MPEEYETLLHSWFEEVWNKQSDAAIDEMCIEDVVAHGLTNTAGETIRGREGFKALHRAFVSAYPNIKITVEDTISEGDKIAARRTIRAIHEGIGIGAAPTDQPVEFI